MYEGPSLQSLVRPRTIPRDTRDRSAGRDPVLAPLPQVSLSDTNLCSPHPDVVCPEKDTEYLVEGSRKGFSSKSTRARVLSSDQRGGHSLEERADGGVLKGSLRANRRFLPYERRNGSSLR